MPNFHELNPSAEITNQVFRSPNEARRAYPVIEKIEDVFSPQLTSVVRYNRYRSDETIGEWVRLLGPDALALTHPHQSALTTHDLVITQEAYGQPFGSALRNALYTAPWIHDFGELELEGKGVGDVSFDKKTEADERVEIEIFDTVMNALATPPERQDLSDIYRTIAMDKNSPLGKAFHIVERVGYMETVIRAYLGVSGERIENWQGLVGNVLSNNFPALLAPREKYPYLDIFLQENGPIIDEMFNDTVNHEVRFDREGTLSYDPAKLSAANEAWSLRNSN